MDDANKRIARRGQRRAQEPQAGLLGEIMEAAPSNALRSQSQRGNASC